MEVSTPAKVKCWTSWGVLIVMKVEKVSSWYRLLGEIITGTPIVSLGQSDLNIIQLWHLWLEHLREIGMIILSERVLLKAKRQGSWICMSIAFSRGKPELNSAQLCIGQGKLLTTSTQMSEDLSFKGKCPMYAWFYWCLTEGGFGCISSSINERSLVVSSNWRHLSRSSHMEEDQEHTHIIPSKFRSIQMLYHPS